jgi:Domain of unknown function (DUF4440)
VLGVPSHEKNQALTLSFLRFFSTSQSGLARTRSPLPRKDFGCDWDFPEFHGEPCSVIVSSRSPAFDNCQAERGCSNASGLLSKGTIMRLQPPMIMALLLLPTSFSHAQSNDNDAGGRAYIQQAEYDWAQSLVTNDVRVIERIFADDFAGVDIDGSLYSKTDTINGSRTAPSEFVSVHLNAIEIRLYGDAAVVQGNESWEDKDGTPGKFVWTDTWIRRDGRWQIVAAEDVVVAEDPLSTVVPGLLQRPTGNQ